MQKIIRTVRRMTGLSGQGSSDEQLLERFFTGREDSAFAELVQRHGPMVMGVCLRILQHPQDAEDAFQATFLTLVRKGEGIRRRAAVANWLYRVAYRVSLSLRARVERDRPLEEPVVAVADGDPVATAAWRELIEALDHELQRLPAKYRLALVLCYLEGKTYEEAAELIGCPRNTMAVRLLRARGMLRERLRGRALFGAAGLLGLYMTLPGSTAVSAELATATSASVLAVAGGTTMNTVVPAGVAALVQAATRDLWFEKCRAAITLALALIGLAGTATGVIARGDLNPAPPTQTIASRSPIGNALPAVDGAVIRDTGAHAIWQSTNGEQMKK